MLINIFQLFIIPIFILLNGFFVAAEMSLARVRRTRIDQLAEEGNKAAQLAQVSLEDPERFISACQLGITVATLALGAVGESAFADNLAQMMVSIGLVQHWSDQISNFARVFSFAVAFGVTAFFQTVLGELIPKTWTFDRAEVGHSRFDWTNGSLVPFDVTNYWTFELFNRGDFEIATC